MEKMKNACTNLVGQTVGKQQFGRPKSCKANIQMYLTDNYCVWNGSQQCPVVDGGTLGLYHTKDT
jgi:hypothetical protein